MLLLVEQLSMSAPVLRSPFVLLAERLAVSASMFDLPPRLCCSRRPCCW